MKLKYPFDWYQATRSGRASVLGSRCKVLALLALVLAGGFARAQSNDVPGDTEYAAFSRFITQRNIFDPNRYPHETHTYHRPRNSMRLNSAPAFTLVGTMSYGKGTFAFFSGNSDEFKKILPVSGTIAGYEVTGITMAGASLQGADKKAIQLNIGDQLRQENNGWRVAGSADAVVGSSEGGAASSEGGVSGAGPTPDSSVAAPSAGLGNNEILKRLMQLREQENK